VVDFGDDPPTGHFRGDLRRPVDDALAGGLTPTLSVARSEPIHCHHADVVAHIHSLEMLIVRLQQELYQLQAKTCQLHDWIQLDEDRSRWFYEQEAELRSLVLSSRWVSTTRRVMAWLMGTVIGIVALWSAIEGWLKGNLRG
jgi:hypothetical protein